MNQKQKTVHLLVIGPLPPPLAGTSVSFKLFCEFLDRKSDKVKIKVLNSAPKKLGTRPLLNFSNLSTASRILWGCLSEVGKSNKVLLFGSNQFLVSMMPICLLISKLAGKKFYVRSFGGSLDSYYLNLSPIVRLYFHCVLKYVDGLIVQTALLKQFFSKFMGSRVHLVPGYREPAGDISSHTTIDKAPLVLRLVYVGHIHRQKGIFDLLDSIKLLNANQPLKVTCEFYGPIYGEDSALFNCEISMTNGASYGGVLEPGRVIQVIAHYDVFVFPTYYKGEGHPGVLIEAMMAGLPIVSTNFKSIPDLIEHGYNGLLVTPEKPQELADTIQTLRTNDKLLKKLKEHSRQSGKKYCAEKVIPLLLEAIEVGYQ